MSKKTFQDVVEESVVSRVYALDELKGEHRKTILSNMDRNFKQLLYVTNLI